MFVCLETGKWRRASDEAMVGGSCLARKTNETSMADLMNIV
jgi:hypothetical protein